MNRDDVIRMARAAGMSVLMPDEHVDGIGGIYIAPDDSCLQEIERFAALVAAHEREECARVCEETTFAWTEHAYYSGCMDCAAAIRARGNDEPT